MTSLATPDLPSEKATLSNGLPTSDAAVVDAQKTMERLMKEDPFILVELALEIGTEKTRTIEALKARDAVVQRLVDAYESLRQKTAAVELLQQNLQQKSRVNSPFLSDSAALDKTETARMKDEIARLERTIVELRIEIRLLKENVPNIPKLKDPALVFEERMLKNNVEIRPASRQISAEFPRPISRPTDSPGPVQLSQTPRLRTPDETAAGSGLQTPPSAFIPASDEPADMIAARNAILASLPLPEEVPDDTLSPLSIPAPLSLQEFICTLTGPLRISLTNFRIFYSTTTQWCPEREEHGYFYMPTFKCSTNPRVATAHRWNIVDVVPRVTKPTECFFTKGGIWYYAGVYKTFRLADLTLKEWAELPNETTQAIVKETIAARKNTSPQNVYEISQLYAVGALKVACVAIQCIGFNNATYKALLEQARMFAHTKWVNTNASAGMGKASPVPVANPTAPLASGSTWNSNASASEGGGIGPAGPLGGVPLGAGDLVVGMAAMNLGRQSQNGQKNENIPTPIGEGRKR